MFLKHKSITNFSWYFATSLINKALPFFLLPILTRYLSPEEYGVLAIYQILITFATPFVGMNMPANITRNFFRQSRDELAKLTSNLLFVLSGSFTLVILVLMIIVLSGNNFWDIPSSWLFSIPVVAGMNVINQMNLTILRNSKQALKYGLFEISQTSLNLVITLLLVVVYHFGWQGRTTGIAVASITFGIISLIHVYKTGFLQFDISKLKIREILYISLPLIPHMLSTGIIDMSDRFFIDHMFGKEAVGIYNVGYQFGLGMILFTDAFSQVWSPWMYEQLAHMTAVKKLKIVQLTYIFDVGVIILALLITMLSGFLIKIMTPVAYHGATKFVLWVALGYALRGMYTMVFHYLVHEGKTKFLGIITLVSAIVNLVANFILLRLNGVVGAAQATLLAYTIQFLLVWWYANRIHPMPWGIIRNILHKSVTVQKELRN